MNRLIGTIIAAMVFAVVFWLFPLFHIIPLKVAEKEKAAATFDPKTFTEKFWRERLLQSLDKAVNCDVLLPAIRNNATEARDKFSHRVGMSESYLYFVTGQGRVLAASEDEITLAVNEGLTTPEISLQVGPLFGNTIRDGTGLLDVNNYPNSQEFNDISAALNHIVETAVLPKLRAQAKPGSIVRFTGCVEVNDESTDLKPLRVVPITADVQ